MPELFLRKKTENILFEIDDRNFINSGYVGKCQKTQEFEGIDFV